MLVGFPRPVHSLPATRSTTSPLSSSVHLILCISCVRFLCMGFLMSEALLYLKFAHVFLGLFPVVRVARHQGFAQVVSLCHANGLVPSFWVGFSAHNIDIEFVRRISGQGAGLAACYSTDNLLFFFLRNFYARHVGNLLGGRKSGSAFGNGATVAPIKAVSDDRSGQTNALKCNPGLLISTSRSLSINKK